MTLTNGTYFIPKNEEEFKKIFLILCTYFREDILCINDYSTWPIIYIYNNTIHGCKNSNHLKEYNFKEMNYYSFLKKY